MALKLIIRFLSHIHIITMKTTMLYWFHYCTSE